MKKILLTLYVSLSVSLLLCIIIPSQLFFNNSNEFLVNYTDILLPLMVYFFAGSLILFITGIIVGKIHPKLNMFYIILLVTAVIVIWINNQFFEVKVLFDGNEYVETRSVKSLINILLSFIVLFVIYFVSKTKDYIKNYYIIITIVLISISASLYSSIINSNYKTTPKKEYTINENGDNLLNFSKDKNILYIILDAYDAAYLHTILKEDDNNTYNNILKDFTFFTNYVSAVPATRGSGMVQFAGKIYKNEIPYNEYRKKVYIDDKSSFFNLTVNNGWENSIYPDENGGAGSYSPDITLYSNKHRKNKIIDNKNTDMLINASVYISAPIIIKNKLRKLQALRKRWDYDFLNIVEEKGVSTGSKNRFTLLHLVGAHTPFIINEDMKISRKATAVTQSQASLKLVNILLNKMKEQGVYDNTIIFIAADHGGQGLRWNPILLIKDQNINKEKIDINNTPVYQQDIKSILEKYAFTDNFSSAQITAGSKREFYMHDGLNLLDKAYSPPLTVYEVPDNISSINNLEQLKVTGYYAPNIESWDVNRHKIYDFKEHDLPDGSLGTLWEKTSSGIIGRRNIWIKLDSQDIHHFLLKFYMGLSPLQENNIEKTVKTDGIAGKKRYNLNENNIITDYIEAKDFVNIYFHNKVEIEKIEVIPFENNCQKLDAEIKQNDSGYRLTIPTAENNGVIKINYTDTDGRSQNITVKQDGYEIEKIVSKRSGYIYISLDDIFVQNKKINIEITAEHPESIVLGEIYQYLSYAPADYIDSDNHIKYIPASLMDETVLKSGWVNRGDNFITGSKDAVLHIPYLNNIYKNGGGLNLHIGCNVFINNEKQQNLYLYVNNDLIKKYPVIKQGMNEYEFFIDNKYLDKDIDIRLMTEYDIYNYNGKNTDSAFELKYIKLQKPFLFKEGYKAVYAIDNHVFSKNWYEKETELIWAKNNAVLRLPFDTTILKKDSVTLILDGYLFFNKDKTPQTLGFYVNNNLLQKYKVKYNNNQKYSVTIPKKYIKDVVDLEIKTEYEASPKANGESDDSRALAFALRGIEVE